MEIAMNLTLKIWRQKNAKNKGKIVEYPIDGISPDMSFLEMLDVLNQKLITAGEEPVAFDHDCREGICGSCSLYINGEAHGPDRRVTTCQLHMRKFKDGDTIFIEPFRANSFPVIKDLIVDRSAFDRIQHAGGFISVNTSGNTQDGNAIPISKHAADEAMMPLLVLVVVLVLRLVKTPLQCCLLVQKFLNMHCCHKDKWKQQIEFKIWLHKWIWKALETAPIQVLVKWNAQKEFH